MNLRVCIVTATPELAYDAANHAIDHAKGPVSVMVGANARSLCSLQENLFHPCAQLLLEDYEKNEGVVPVMHKLWQHASGSYPNAQEDLLAFIHDDCQILEYGWDERVKARFRASPNCDAVGFVGGTGIGAADIYRAPYQTIHLGRHGVHSNMVDAEAHGRRTHSDMRIATADGCALVVRRSFLDRHGGWSPWWPEVNHGYDNALACMLRREGREMWLVPVTFRHPSAVKLSGRFRNAVASQQYQEQFGGDAHVHAVAHQRLYDTFRDVLPFHV